MKISELCKKNDNLLILHGISKVSPESEIPDNIKFVDQIKYSITNSQFSKLSAFSFIFSKHNESNLFNRMGIIIKEGDIIDAFPEDSGLRSEDINKLYTATGNNISDVVVAARKGHNELILQKVEVAGIYFNMFLPDCSCEEVHNASVELNLPVYFMDMIGLYHMKWDEESSKFIPDNSVGLKISSIIHELLFGGR